MDVRKKIGEGTFGNVYSMIHESKPVAVKQIKPHPKGIRSLLELSIMNTYQHPHIAQAINITTSFTDGATTIEPGSSVPIIEIYQELALCDLRKFVLEYWPTGMNKSQAKQLLHEIISAVDFLHLEGIIHCDIKPHNVLVFKNYVKLCDCGSAVIYSSGLRKYMTGTTKYNSPEMLMGLSWGMPTDIWSLACLFHEVLTGKHFMGAIKHNEVEHRRRAAKSIQLWREDMGDVIVNKLDSIRCIPINFTLTGKCSRKLVIQMTSYDPSCRPTIDQVKSHAWFGKLVSTRYNSDVKSRVISKKHFTQGWEQVSAYVARRYLKVNYEVLYKAAELYGRLDTIHQTVELLEACLQMSCKMHQVIIAHFHPATPKPKLIELEFFICAELEYRLHKCSYNNYYIPMG